MNELDLFAAAIDVADPAQRAALLERECAGLPELRKRIDQLLEAHFKPNAALDQPASECTESHLPAGALSGATTKGPPPALGAEGSIVAGRYKLLQQIGEGGMGSVWMAD
jgi:hypothetical protein